MGLPLHKEQGFDIGINPTITDDINLKRLLTDLKRFLCTPIELIYQAIPKRPGLRSTTSFKILTFIYCTPATTKQHISDMIDCNNEAVKRSVEYLLKLGYIRMMPSMRYVKPFNSYKQERTYLITPKGKTVLSKLLNY